MERKTINKYGIISLIIICIYITLDYFNIFSNITKNLNIEILNIIVNSIVVIFVFMVTYKLVDKKTIEKEEITKKNKLSTLNIMLQEVYSHCNTVIDTLDDGELLEKYIIPKINFNSLQNEVEDNLKELPFTNETYIIGLFSDGITTKDIIHDYFQFKNLYQSYVHEKITFFDVSIYTSKEVFEMLEKDKLKLKKIINTNLSKISNDKSV